MPGLPVGAPLTCLKGVVGTTRRRPDSRLPTARLASRAPTVPSPTASPRAPPAAAIRSRPRVTERVDAAVYPVCVPMSTPRRCVLAPPGHTKPLHRRPRRSPPNRRAARRWRPCLVVPPDAIVYAHELVPRRRPRAGEAPPCFPRLPLVRR
jgi:hypothetical protein